MQDHAEVVNDLIYGNDALVVSTNKLAKNKKSITGVAASTMDEDTNRSQTFNRNLMYVHCVENHIFTVCGMVYSI